MQRHYKGGKHVDQLPPDCVSRVRIPADFSTNRHLNNQMPALDTIQFRHIVDSDLLPIVSVQELNKAVDFRASELGAAKQEHSTVHARTPI